MPRRVRRRAQPHRRRARRRHLGGRCRVTGKTGFTTFDAAAGTAARIDGERPYPCPMCGCWHVTRSTREDYDRRLADLLARAV